MVTKKLVLNPPLKVSFRGMVQLPPGKKEVVLTPPHKVSFRGCLQLPPGICEAEVSFTYIKRAESGCWYRNDVILSIQKLSNHLPLY